MSEYDDSPCAICGKTEDESPLGSEWTNCDICLLWYHNSCANIPEKLPEDESWQCESCKLAATEKAKKPAGKKNPKEKEATSGGSEPQKNPLGSKNPAPGDQQPPRPVTSAFTQMGDGQHPQRVNSPVFKPIGDDYQSLPSSSPRVSPQPNPDLEPDPELATLAQELTEAQQRADEIQAQKAAEKAEKLKREKEKLQRQKDLIEAGGSRENKPPILQDDYDRVAQELAELKAREHERKRAQQIQAMKDEIARLKAQEKEWEEEQEKKPDQEKTAESGTRNSPTQTREVVGVLDAFMQRQLELANQQAAMALPKFSGKPNTTRWMTWIQLFHAAQATCNFSPERNMMRLSDAIEEPARRYIENALAIPNNVEAVLEILNVRYGNLDQIIQEEMRKLSDLTPPTDGRPDSIVNFFEFLLGLKATLCGAQATAYLTAPQTMDVIVRKLPPGTQTAWITHKRKFPGAGLDQFLKWYEPHYYSAANRLTSMPSVRKPPQRINHHEERREKGEGCPLCRKDNHSLRDCRRFAAKDLNGRWETVKKVRWCSGCLQGKHWHKDCPSPIKCGLDGCERNHHQLLHKKQEPPKKPEQKRPEETNAHHHDAMKTFYRVVPVKLINEDKCVETWAFLDEGSGPTLMSQEVADKLALRVQPKELCLSWSDGTTKRLQSGVVELKLQGLSEKSQYSLRNVQTVPYLDLPAPKLNVDELKSRYTHLNDVQIPEIAAEKPEILIGLEHVRLMVPHKIREGSWNEPVATKTRIGWAIYGRARGNSTSHNYSCTICECSESNVNSEKEINSLIKSFQTTEEFGVTAPAHELKSLNDERALKTLAQTLKYKEGRYEVGLLWKERNVLLPDNRAAALKRLACFEQRLLKDPVLKSAVCKKFQENLEKGYLRETSPEELAAFPGPKWFLPVFAVTNPNKPGKIRLVYDAAAKCEGISLNDTLLKGPDNLTSLLGVLLRFREGKIAICGDIAEMFHRVKIIEGDQFAQLVLWRDVDTTKPPRILRLTVMSFGATCSPSEAQHVKNTNATKFQRESPRAVQAILNRHYVDDYLDSANSVPEMVKIVEDVKRIHAHGGFEIRNWISNSRDVMNAVNPANQDSKNSTISLDKSEDQCSEKVLGMHWDFKNDQFIFKTNFVRVDPAVRELKRRPTKREVTSLVMSLFDPFGMLSTIVLPAKSLIQDLWRCGCDWDDSIPEEIYSAWKNWMTALEKVGNVKVPRWFSQLLPNVDEIQLHVFCDASELAFCAVAYLRMKKGQTIDVAFVAAKTRVAPQKPLSIPRLELQGAVLAARLAATLQSEIELNLETVGFWTDSQTVLGWLRSAHRRYSAFVGHRVGEILDHTDLESWRWVPGKENVADEGTKWEGCPEVSERWFAGPAFLLKDENQWPMEKNRVVSTAEEEKSVQYHAFHARMRPGFDIIQPERYSNWKRLLRATAFMLRYIKKLRERPGKKGEQIKVLMPSALKTTIKNIVELSGVELEVAQKLLIKKVQHECYQGEIKNGAAVKNSKIYNLNPFVDEEGIIRVTTRLDAAPALIDDGMKRPILLDGDHPITILMIDTVHRKFHHKNRETVVNELRQHLWIPKIRVHVNKVIRRCNLCAFIRSKPQVPRMAPLPRQRLQPFAAPFTNTGIDYAGPFQVAVGRRREKRWIVLFTCLSMRALHLEVASSMDTSSCVMAIRNFMNRRGCPAEIFSDNGTNLKAGEKELKELLGNLDTNEIMAKSQELKPGSNGVRWNFNPPTASHFGGIWERMVRSVKDCLYIVLKEKAPADEIFRSAIIEVEATVNSRPLYYSPTEDLNQPAITPNSLLRFTLNEVLPQNPEELATRKHWTRVQEIAYDFWTKWLKHYLPTISLRTKWFDETKPLEIGRLVLIVDDSLKRGEWKRGLVQAVHPGRDGRIRSATVKTAKGTYQRPVSKLAVIKNENLEI